MWFEDTDFNSEYWSRFTEEEFVRLNMASVVFANYQNREELFRQAYQLIQYELNPSFTPEKSKGHEYPQGSS